MRYLCGIVLATVALSAACATSSATRRSDAAEPAGTPTTQTGTTTAQSAPRLTADDYQGFMKTVGATYPAMRMHLMEGKTAEAAKEADTLAMTFGNVERFWLQNNKADAVKLAQQARMYATETAGAATAGDVMKATRSAENMQGMCKQCHGMYREMDPANPKGFRIKPGVLTAG